MSSLKLQVSELSSQLELKISSKDQKVIKDDLINISNRIEGYIRHSASNSGINLLV